MSRTCLRLAILLAVAAAAVLAVGPVAAADRWVTVQAGDTLGQIALDEGVSVEQLVTINGLADADHILVGQRLRITASGGGAGETASRTHVVAAGESVWGLALRYGTSIEAIAAANELADPSLVMAGQRLLIPGQGGPADPSPTPRPARIHRVAAGESLWGIAVRYGTSVDRLARRNGLADPSLIWVGQLLEIPGRGRRAAAVAMPAEMAALVAQRSAVRHRIAAEARAQGVPVAFALAVAWQESGWQQHVRSSAGAIGVMQLMPATADWVSAVMLNRPVDATNTDDNVRAGVRLLRHYLDRYGDRSLALAAYYQGQRSVDLYGIYAESRPYIASILALEAIFSGLT